MNAMQRYEEKYDYDEVGNMLHMIQMQATEYSANKWTRIFSYNATNNRLSANTGGCKHHQLQL